MKEKKKSKEKSETEDSFLDLIRHVSIKNF